MNSSSVAATAALTDEATSTFDRLGREFHSAVRDESHATPGDRTVRDLRKQLTDGDYLFAGRGDGRIVFTVPEDLTTTDQELVVKFAMAPWDGCEGDTTDGRYQNRVEVAAAAHVPCDLAEHFASVVDAGDDGYWVVMEYVRGLDPFEDDFDWQTPLYTRLAGSEFYDLDLGRQNVGWLETGDDDLDPHDPLVDGSERIVVRDLGWFNGGTVPEQFC